MAFAGNLLAYCGIYCDQCSARVAFIERDDKHLEKYPAKYKRDGTAMTAYDCEGCKGQSRCGACAIRECASGKGMDASCAACGEFPCALLDAFENDGLPHHRRAIENLRCIREIGVEAWFEKLRPALRCHCGERQSWYHACPEHA